MENDLRQELSTNFIEYAASVNSDRAIPDATSGLKPVARRILYAAYAGGRTSAKPHVKCATIVGDVIGNYHPHGDSSVYGALVRLSQNWVMRYPLIDFHGNVGNIGGDGPAHYRYTEARLAKVSEDGLLAGLKKKNVPFMPTFDDSQEEPTTLPAIFPNLLCNPNAGIGVAMSCSWAPHNLKEVANAIFDYMEGKQPMLPGPDFPTGGIIINKNDVPTIMATGHGSVKVRGRYKIEKNNIIFYEIPYGTTIEDLLKEVGALSDSKEIEGISDIRDESNKNGIRIVIECNRDALPEKVVSLLFAKTDFQSSFSYNQVALVDKTPMELNLKQCIEIYLNHNINCLKRELNFDLNKSVERQEIVSGLLKALEDIDNIITLIKKSESAAAATRQLVAQYKFSEAQAKAIVDMKLGRLAGLEKIELEKENADLIANINRINNILSSEDLQKEEIKNRLTAIVKKYGDDRRTELAQIEVPKAEKVVEEVMPEDCVVITTHDGMIKRIAAAAFKPQHRAGKGIKTTDGAALSVISTNTIDTLMLFSNRGLMYRVIVDKVPAGTSTSGGGRVEDIIQLGEDEKIIAVTSLYRHSAAEYVVFLTKNGYFKKTALEEYTNTKKSTGIISIKLSEGDSLANVTFCNDEDFILLSKNGMAIHFETKSIAPVGRVTLGVRAMKLVEGDEILLGLPIHKNTDNLAVFTDKGYGKKMSLDEFPIQGRNGKGVVFFKNSGMFGNVVAAAMVGEKDLIALVGIPNSICIDEKEISLQSRISSGVSLIKGSQVTAAVKI